MVNSLQMLMTYCYMVVTVPANVLLVMTQVNTVASFDYFPAEYIMNFCFDFSKTVVPFASFKDMVS
jgi:hypothetical protein